MDACRKGNYARDDKIKYPERSSTTGGFAGGERGVDKFVQDGDLSFAPEGEFRKQVRCPGLCWHLMVSLVPVRAVRPIAYPK